MTALMNQIEKELKKAVIQMGKAEKVKSSYDGTGNYEKFSEAEKTYKKYDKMFSVLYNAKRDLESLINS